MGELVDSSGMKNVSIAQYSARTSKYLAAFPTGVDVWEIGNEINGNWLGATADVVAKMTNAFDLVKSPPAARPSSRSTDAATAESPPTCSTGSRPTSPRGC